MTKIMIYGMLGNFIKDIIINTDVDISKGDYIKYKEKKDNTVFINTLQVSKITHNIDFFDIDDNKYSKEIKANLIDISKE